MQRPDDRRISKSAIRTIGAPPDHVAPSTKNSLLGVSRALQTLLLFRTSPELGVREIARRLDINSAAAHRAITTLTEYGFLEHLSDSRTYTLGHSIAELGEVISSSRGFSQIAISLMQPLRDETKETLALHEINNGMRNCIISLDSPLALRMVVPTGLKVRITNGAVDLVLRAFGNPDELAQIAAHLVGLTGPTADETTHGSGLGSPPTNKEIDAVRKRGWAVTYGVRSAGSVAVAAPVPLNGRIFALALFGPQDRMVQLGVERMAQRVMEVASNMAVSLNGLRPGVST